MELKISALLDLEHTLAKEYLSGFVFPWEALDGGKLLFCLLSRRLSETAAVSVCKAVSRVTLGLLGGLMLAVGLHAEFPMWYLLLSVLLLTTGFC